jgi:hypothetical protein
VGISDLANSDFTGRGQWRVVSQPAGANVTLGSTYYIYISIRADVGGRHTLAEATRISDF